MPHPAGLVNPMGLPVEHYSLHELQRIAIPGTAPPCLFWAVPVGKWRAAVLDEWWRSFTEGDGECREYGLLLRNAGSKVRATTRRKASQQ